MSLQINTIPFASDALEDAMRLAQTKALNSYSWSDMFNYLNYTWMTIYQKVAQVDDGYYSRTMRLTEKLTHIPKYVKNTLVVYAAQDKYDYNRDVFRSSGMNDLKSMSTYHLSGLDLYCPDVMFRRVWLNYLPEQPQLFFTRNNRDPKIYNYDITASNITFPKISTIAELADGSNFKQRYNLYNLVYDKIAMPDIAPVLTTYPFSFNKIGSATLKLVYNNPEAGIETDIHDLVYFMDDDNWIVTDIVADFPYLFVTYYNQVSNIFKSGFFKNIVQNSEFNEYNPFSFTGRLNDVEYCYARYSDKTGLGVIVKDWNDMQTLTSADGTTVKYTVPTVKELGWTPDSKLDYPDPVMYRYLVALLAKKLSSFDSTNVMGVQTELADAQQAFALFLKKDKSAWSRITNVNGPTVSDLL
jgi:hypothetical protein